MRPQDDTVDSDVGIRANNCLVEEPTSREIVADAWTPRHTQPSPPRLSGSDMHAAVLPGRAWL